MAAIFPLYGDPKRHFCKVKVSNIFMRRQAWFKFVGIQVSHIKPYANAHDKHFFPNLDLDKAMYKWVPH